MKDNIWQFIQNHAPTTATIFFFLFFCYVVYSLFKKGQEQKFNDYAKIPFNEEDKNKKTNNHNAQNSDEGVKNKAIINHTN